VGGPFLLYYLRLIAEKECQMFDKIRKWLHIDLPPEPEVALPPEPEVAPQPEPEPNIPPDVIEIPWKFAASPKNLQDAIGKIHGELKDFIYEAKLREVHALKNIDRILDLKRQKIEQLKEAYAIPEDMEYDFVLPEATGRPGYLKKKESK
tara:strand:+ start:521 stop:970 length:450 start_codon:yes stop_codon:yes gene_type:complete